MNQIGANGGNYGPAGVLRSPDEDGRLSDRSVGSRGRDYPGRSDALGPQLPRMITLRDAGLRTRSRVDATPNAWEVDVMS